MLASELLRRLMPDPASADVAAVANLFTFDSVPLVMWGRTPAIDFLAASPPNDYALSLPVVPGTEILGAVGRLRVLTRTGTATGGVGWQIGNNATFDNFVPAASGGLTAATINGAGAAPGGIVTLIAGLLAVDMSTTAMKVRVTLNPTGLSAYTGYLAYAALYAPT